MPGSGVPAVGARDLPGDAILVDVREPEEWIAGHAPGAIHIPMGQIPQRLAEIPTDADLVIVCHVGGRSARVTAFLTQQGIACRNLTGGMVAYAAAGREVVSENGLPPVVD